MAYVTPAEFNTYIETYGGDTIKESDLNKLLEVASLDVDKLTFGRIGTLTDRTTFQQTNIKNATCSHAITLSTYGDTSNQLNDDRDISLGDLSVKGSSSDITNRVSNRTIEFLMKTGLMNRSLNYGATGNPFLDYWYGLS